MLAGKRRVDGIEMQLAGTITPNWEVYSGIAFMTTARSCRPTANQGNTPLGVAESSGNVWTVYRLGGGWEIGGGARYNSGFWLTDANNGEVPAYTRVGRHRRLRADEIRGAAERVQPGRQDSITSAATRTTPNRVLPGEPRTRLAHRCRYNVQPPEGSRCSCEIPAVLTPTRSPSSAPRIDAARWVDGNVTSGHQSAQGEVQRAAARGIAPRRASWASMVVAGAVAQPAVLFGRAAASRCSRRCSTATARA